MNPRTAQVTRLTLIGLVGLAGCVTAPEAEMKVRSAILSDVSEGSTRDLIRVHVLDLLGTGYVADIDALGRSDRMIAKDDGRSQARGARIPLPDRIFHLEIISRSEGRICQLVSDQPDADALILPQNISCEPAP